MIDNNVINNLQWLKNFGNSCRYDSFLTVFFGSIYKDIKIVKELYNNFICETCKTLEDIILNHNFRRVETLWKYFIDKRLDYNMILVPENINSFNDDGFGVSGCVYQLFKMFSNEYDFCLKEKKRHECYNCNSIYYDAEQYRNVFISITKNYFQIKDIPIILNIIQSNEGYGYCNKCNCNLETCYNNFEIINYSKYIFVVFDVLSFNELNYNKKDIIRLTNFEIYFKEEIKYNLSSIIACPYGVHYTSIIIKYDGDEYEGLLKKNRNYYHDDMKNDGCFIELGDNPLEEIPDIPYILIYKKSS